VRFVNQFIEYCQKFEGMVAWNGGNWQSGGRI
jgi:hypothetical protein